MMQSITILVLEDNPDDLYILKEMLESSEEIQICILHEERLENALKVPLQEKVDIAMIDLNLPDSNGLETFVDFNKAHPRIPAIINTGQKDRTIALKAVQEGAQDYLFKGEPSSTAIVRTILYAIERHRLMSELQLALDEIKTLKGIIPICAHCKKIRDDKGYWNLLEKYIERFSDASCSQSMCPECMEALYGNEDWYIEMQQDLDSESS